MEIKLESEKINCPNNNMRILAQLYQRPDLIHIGSDLENAQLFANIYQGRAKYVYERGIWAVYNGRYWQYDMKKVRMMELAKELGKCLIEYMYSPSSNRYPQAKKDAETWLMRSTRERLLLDASGLLSASVEDFDKQPYLVNVLNGTIDMKNWEFREHRAEDFLTKIMNVEYNPDAKTAIWDAFIAEVLKAEDDKATYDKIRYFQKMIGYTLTGSTKYDSMFLLYGESTRNGKSTTMSTLLKLFGTYGTVMKPATIGCKKYDNASAPSSDIARLCGSRLVVAGEPSQTLQLDAALIKSITGGDRLVGRFLHEENFEFTPQFKMFIHTNSLPAIDDSSVFASGRVKVLKFEQQFIGDRQDPGIADKLQEPKVLSGILNWAIEGAKMLQEEGFREPECIQTATESYRKENDSLERFMDENLVQDPNGSIKAAVFRSEYEIWCRLNQKFRKPQSAVTSYLQSMGCYKRQNDGMHVTGYRFGSELKNNKHIEKVVS